MNQDNPYAMNQTCKVCGEPAAGFHFGAFTCEGCKSFFGRSYNNITSIADCKNNGECIINKKNRTACKACRLRKCLMVGMSKSGSRYGRRSNWFKIHCLMQEQQQQAAAAMAAAAAAQQHNSHHHLRQHQSGQQPPSHLHHGQQHHQNAHAAAVHHQQAVAAAAAAHMQGLAAAAAAVAASGQKAAACEAGPTAVAGAPLPGDGMPPGTGPPMGMLYHGGPRSKEELLMLGLDEYTKHPRISPSVGSPDSHHSDSSSVEVSVTRGSSASNHSLLHSQRRTGSSAGTPPPNAVGQPVSGGTAPLPPPQPLQLGRKDLPASAAFLPLHFPGLGSMPVMPPPPFLPPSHLLLPGYHPALYPHHHAHHHGLLKPSAEQQQQAVAAAAAVQHLFNSAARFAPVAPVAQPKDDNVGDRMCSPSKGITNAQCTTSATNTIHNNNNNNHIPNGSKSAEELTKRFYLDAVLKSQCYGVSGGGSPPPTTTKLPAHPKYDHSISALVTPNSESGRDRLRSRQSNEGEDDDDDDANDDDDAEPNNERVNAVDQQSSDGVKLPAPPNDGSDCDEDLVVSMTPPRSPPPHGNHHGSPTSLLLGQDDPIDLSMKTTGSSSVRSLSSTGSGVGPDEEHTPNAVAADVLADEEPTEPSDGCRSRTDSCSNNNNNNNNSSKENNNNNNDEVNHDGLSDEKVSAECGEPAAEKRKAICCEVPDADGETLKRLKLQSHEDSLPPLDLSKI